MAHYFTREEAEALLPQIAIVLRKIQEGRGAILQTEEELDALRLQAAGNGHHLHERMIEPATSIEPSGPYAAQFGG